MFSKLFGKKREEQPKGANKEKLSSPKDILQPVGQSLVINYKKDPDWVWALKSVTRTYSDDPNHVEFRVYDVGETARSGLHVKNYNSLEERPELILYSGWLDKKTKHLEFEDHRAFDKAV